MRGAAVSVIAATAEARQQVEKKSRKSIKTANINKNKAEGETSKTAKVCAVWVQMSDFEWRL